MLCKNLHAGGVRGLFFHDYYPDRRFSFLRYKDDVLEQKSNTDRIVRKV